MNEKKINVGVILLHFFLLAIFIILPTSYMKDAFAPTWFENYMNPIEYEFVGEEIVIWIIAALVIMAISIGLFFLFALWFKSVYNHTIPIIYNTREIKYWEAFGLNVLMTFVFAYAY